MKVSKQGVLEIASHEALVRSPYLDAVGVWTVGIGHTANAGQPDPKQMRKDRRYSEKWLLEIFRKDLEKFEKRVKKAVNIELEQHEFDALVSFDFNTGGIFKARLTKLLNAGKSKKLVGAAFMGWSRPASIIPRRTKEMRLFLSGKYSNNGTILEYQTNGKGRILWRGTQRIEIDEYI